MTFGTIFHLGVNVETLSHFGLNENNSHVKPIARHYCTTMIQVDILVTAGSEHSWQGNIAKM